jgi:hypothetical protein
MESGRPREEGVAVAVDDDAWWLLGFESRDGRLLWCGCGLGGRPEKKRKLLAILKLKNQENKEDFLK